MVRLLPHLAEGKQGFKVAKSFASVNKKIEGKNWGVRGKFPHRAKSQEMYIQTSIVICNLHHLSKIVIRRVQEGTLHGDHPKSSQAGQAQSKIFSIHALNTEEFIS